MGIYLDKPVGSVYAASNTLEEPMPWFEGTHRESVTVDAPLEATRAYFADPARIVAHTNDVERFEIDDGMVHFVLKPMDYGIVKFQADYRCRYRLEDGVLRWDTPEGNTRQFGEARFSALPDGRTAVDYTETVEVEMQVPAMTAPMLRPVIAQVLASEIKAFLKRMVDAAAADRK